MTATKLVVCQALMNLILDISRLVSTYLSIFSSTFKNSIYEIVLQNFDQVFKHFSVSKNNSLRRQR